MSQWPNKIRIYFLVIQNHCQVQTSSEAAAFFVGTQAIWTVPSSGSIISTRAFLWSHPQGRFLKDSVWKWHTLPLPMTHCTELVTLQGGEVSWEGVILPHIRKRWTLKVSVMSSSVLLTNRFPTESQLFTWLSIPMRKSFSLHLFTVLIGYYFTNSLQQWWAKNLICNPWVTSRLTFYYTS